MAFKKGQSGNPAGKPIGTRNRTTLALEALLQDEAEGITRKAIEMAQAGDSVAMRLCLERLLPIRRDRPVVFELPTIAAAEDLPKATSALLAAVAAGDLTPSEAGEIGKAIDTHLRAVETANLSERLSRLEEQQPEQNTVRRRY